MTYHESGRAPHSKGGPDARAALAALVPVGKLTPRPHHISRVFTNFPTCSDAASILCGVSTSQHSAGTSEAVPCRDEPRQRRSCRMVCGLPGLPAGVPREAAPGRRARTLFLLSSPHCGEPFPSGT